MNLGNVNNVNVNNKWAGIDLGAVKQVSAELIQNANSKTVDLSQANLAAFKRPELGVDFYNQRTSIEAQRQIALTNAQLQINTPASTGFLNAQAAASLYASPSVQRLVEGKMAPAVQEGEAESMKNIFKSTRNLEVYNTQKDKRGTNRNPFAAPAQNQEGIEIEGGLNIVG